MKTRIKIAILDVVMFFMGGFNHCYIRVEDDNGDSYG